MMTKKTFANIVGATTGVLMGGLVFGSQPISHGAELNLQPVESPLAVTVVKVEVPKATFTNEDLICLAKNIYFEARDQPYVGAVAVAHVVLNRKASKRYPGTICKVVTQGMKWKGRIIRNKCQFSWHCDGKPDRPAPNNPIEIAAWEAALILARLILEGQTKDPTNGAMWYHADYVKPYWRSDFKRGPKYGDHIFYLAKR